MADILVIEDDLDTRTLMERWLERDGHQVVSAATAERGLELLADSSFEIAVLDIRLPGMSGLEMRRRMRADDSSEVVILMATVADRDDAPASSADGVWLTKPFERRALLDAVRSALEGLRG